MLYSFYRTRRHFKNVERGIHYVCQDDDKQQDRILPFSNFYLRIQSYIVANATYGKLWACYEPCPRFQNTLFSKSQTNQFKQILIFHFDFFFTACFLYYHKIRLASLKPQLPTHSDKFRVVIGIWMQLQNY